MKKILITIVITLLLVIGFIVVADVCYSPLTNVDSRKIFGKDNVTFEKVCDEDFIGWSPDGAVFDFYIYKVNLDSIDPAYPDFKKETQTDYGEKLKWTKTPVDSSVFELDPLLFNFKRSNTCSCQTVFLEKEIWRSQSNYYSYNIVDERESYFYLYNSTKEIMYYIRRKGF